jgi:hypothetical protein
MGGYFPKIRGDMILVKKFLPILIAVIMVSSIGASAAASNNTTSFNNSQIAQSAGHVKTYINTNYSLPTKVTVGNKNVTTAQFLYLLTSATSNIGNNKKGLVYLKNVSSPSNPTETFTSGTISKASYLSIASYVNTYISKNGKAPSYVTTSLGTIKYQSLVYMFSKVMSSYKVNKTLPSSVYMQSWYASTLGPSGKLNATYSVYKKLGSTSYGYVNLLKPYGTGKNKVAIIVGVHPQEVQTHIAMLNAISALSSKLKNVQIWVFQVVVTKNVSDYSQGRLNGQLLAQKFVVPYINKGTYKLVIDTHGNRGNYYINGKMVKNSIYAPSSSANSNYYNTQIIKNVNGSLVHYNIAEGTSPTYVTIPIAKKGVPALVYEQYLNQANYAKVLYANALEVVKAINKLFA